jgi:MFS transporter, UMF1 family
MADAEAAPPKGRVTTARDRARAVHAWCMYDWANSAFATTVVAAVLPPFFAALAKPYMPANVATAAWAYASSAAMVVSAVSGIALGAVSDRIGRRKPLIAGLVFLGAASTIAMAAVPSQAWGLLLALFALAFIPFASANVLYDSLLPVVAAPDELDRVSARGFAYGYIGGGVLLAINLVWIAMPQRFGFSGIEQATRVSIASVGVWWLGFSIPLLRTVPEPVAERPREPVGAAVANAFRSIGGTLVSLRERPDLLRFLIAYWLYSDGIGTVVRMSTIYGSELGIGRAHLLGALLLVQILAAPASLGFAALARRTTPRQAVIVGLIGYVGICVFGYFVSKPRDFWVLATMVAMVQGGTQALSRSIFASLVPRTRAGEMFGFYSVSEKLAGIAGPLVFGLVAQASGTGRWAVFTLIPFFAIGAWLLATVNVPRGAQAARAEDEAAARLNHLQG